MTTMEAAARVALALMLTDCPGQKPSAKMSAAGRHKFAAPQALF